MSSRDESEIAILLSENSAVDDADDDNIVPSNEVAYQTSEDLEKELSHFRNQWKRELLEQELKTTADPDSSQGSAAGKQKPKNVAEYHEFTTKRKPISAQIPKANDEKIDIYYEQPENNEQKAQYLFNKGVLLEQQGRHYEAIKFYRMAMQLDADIEYKIASHRFTMKPKDQTAPTSEEVDAVEVLVGFENDTDDDSDGMKTLYEQFQSITLQENRFCEKNFPQKSVHFSQLPIEVIMLILKWVVSDHLDMRSLDNFSTVCKGFYVCARDPEIWKLACAKTWGSNNISNYLATYLSWRHMFLNRPRLNFDGVYISKTSYARAGEQSLDNFYRPWHLVEYYRYLRFFSDGNVLVLTTPDEPKITVAKLKSRYVSSNTTTNTGIYSSFVLNDHTILKGTWKLAFNTVSIVACKKIFKAAVNKYSRRQNDIRKPDVDQEHVFRMELELSSGENRMNNQLHWSNYEVTVINKLANTKSTTDFELNKSDFPNFYFSRVKSYSTISDKPLK